MRVPTRSVGLLLAFLLSLGAAQANDADAAKLAAIDRYLKVQPTQRMVDDMAREMAKQVPEAQRAQFSAEMRELLNVQTLEGITRRAMVKTFSVEEIDALAAFYASRHGASVMAKFGAYMGSAMPEILQEVQRAAQVMQQRRQAAQPSKP